MRSVGLQVLIAVSCCSSGRKAVGVPLSERWHMRLDLHRSAWVRGFCGPKQQRLPPWRLFKVAWGNWGNSLQLSAVSHQLMQKLNEQDGVHLGGLIAER